MEFFPATDPSNIYINIDPPEGSGLDYKDRIAKEIEIAISNLNDKDSSNTEESLQSRYNKALVPKTHIVVKGEKITGPSDMVNIENIYSTAVKKSTNSLFSPNSANHLGIDFIDIEKRTHSTYKDIESIRNYVKDITGGQITVKEESNGPPTGPPIFPRYR